MRKNQFGLDAKNRGALLQFASEKHWDLIVIGGGITGAGILLDAQLRGMDVLLLEQNDFASGTSSKSTKLIHGGLRYLKQLDFALVREVGRERSLLHRLAPHLVEPAPMLLPFLEGGSLGKYSAKLGLWLYETLAGVKSSERFKTISTAETIKIEPLLRQEKLLGAAVYTEYQTNDARLTLSILKTAVDEGGYAVNYAKVTNLKQHNGTICGVEATDTQLGNKYTIAASVIVNAGGPWVDEIRKKDQPIEGKRLQLSKGVHISVNATEFPLKNAVYFDGIDGRMIFAIPKGKYVYIGTTDTRYTKSPEEVSIEKQDVEYLLEAWNNRFKGKVMVETDVVSGWAGIRPLIHQDGKKPSELSRKDEIWESSSGLFSIAGGKLTGYRVMAKKATDLVAAKLAKIDGRKFQPCSTAEKTLYGGNFEGFENWQEYAAVQYGEAKEIGATPELMALWVGLFGRETEKIVDLAYSIWPKAADKSEVLRCALLHYLSEKEMLLNIADFYMRRVGLMHFDIAQCYAVFMRHKELWKSTLKAQDEEFKEMEYGFLRELDTIRDGIQKPCE
jgi:glycerol-3-phosphate dehydrogenase